MATDEQPAKKTTKKAAPRVKPTGRPSLLTPQLQERLIDALKTGCYVEDAASYVGISRATVFAWMDRGLKERNRLQAFPDAEPDEKETPYLNFLDAVETARAAAQLRAVAQIQKAAADGTWQAAAWYLERSAPKKWGRKEHTEITGAEGGPLRVDVAVDELEKKITRIVQKRAEQG